jgi:glycosyltransferase involved in cell wall biosynthesis
MEGIPIVWQLLDTRPPVALRRLMMPLVTRLADVVMSTGMEVARVHPGALGLGDRLVPYYPPVDTGNFRPDARRRHAARMELGVPEDAHLIGTVANLNPQKGHEYLVRAAAIVRSELPDVLVRILGAHTPTHADYEVRIEAEARASGLSDGTQLQFIDPGSRIAELLPAFDVFLLTSVPRSEGVPTTILEAMACGLPVVATNVGAVREVVEDDVTGYVVPPLDPEAIAEATLRLLRDPGLRERMGHVGRARATKRFSVETCAEVHLKAYDHALRRKGHPGLLRADQPASLPGAESISSRSQV